MGILALKPPLYHLFLLSYRDYSKSTKQQHSYGLASCCPGAPGPPGAAAASPELRAAAELLYITGQLVEVVREVATCWWT